jgi:hypothetical protein
MTQKTPIFLSIFGVAHLVHISISASPNINKERSIRDGAIGLLARGM